MRLAEPEIFGLRRASFAITYDFALHISKIIEASGLWRPVPGSDYGKWAASMNKLKVWDAHGLAGMAFANSDDVIVDICAQKKPSTPTSP